MADKHEDGRWIDATGTPVPVKYIDPVDKRRDRMVEKQVRAALAAQKRVAKFKKVVLEDIKKYLDWLADKYGETTINPAGNYILTNFSGNRRVQIKMNKVISFDERLQLAKEKIDECIERWSEGADDKLKIIIFDAFKTDNKGNIDTKRVLGLRKLQIKDDDWLEAMDLIAEAITISGTREYLLVQVRPDSNADWQTVRFDLAGV